MEPFLDRLLDLLSRLPVPALPLDQAIARLRHTGGSPLPPEEMLVQAIGRSERFRILEAPRSPRGRVATPGSPRRGKPVASPFAGPWVVALTPGGGTGPEVLDRLRRSLVILGGALDDRSVASFAHWFRMMSETASLERVLRERREAARPPREGGLSTGPPSISRPAAPRPGQGDGASQISPAGAGRSTTRARDPRRRARARPS